MLDFFLLPLFLIFRIQEKSLITHLSKFHHQKHYCIPVFLLSCSIQPLYITSFFLNDFLHTTRKSLLCHACVIEKTEGNLTLSIFKKWYYFAIASSYFFMSYLTSMSIFKLGKITLIRRSRESPCPRIMQLYKSLNYLLIPLIKDCVVKITYKFKCLYVFNKIAS